MYCWNRLQISSGATNCLARRTASSLPRLQPQSQRPRARPINRGNRGTAADFDDLRSGEHSKPIKQGLCVASQHLSLTSEPLLFCLPILENVLLDLHHHVPLHLLSGSADNCPAEARRHFVHPSRIHPPCSQEETRERYDYSREHNVRLQICCVFRIGVDRRKRKELLVCSESVLIGYVLRTDET